MAAVGEQVELVELFYSGTDFKFADRFQSFTNELYTYDGKQYRFLDIDAIGVGYRRCQYSARPQRLRMRSNVYSSQNPSAQTPSVDLLDSNLQPVSGQSIEVANFRLDKPLQLLEKTDGLSGAYLKIIRHYPDNETKDRRFVYVVDSSMVKNGVIELKLSSGMSPISTMVPTRMRKY